MEYIFNPNSTSQPYDNALSFGINTSVLWINIGTDITCILTLIALWPIIYLISKVLLYIDLMHGRKTIN